MKPILVATFFILALSTGVLLAITCSEDSDNGGNPVITHTVITDESSAISSTSIQIDDPEMQSIAGGSFQMGSSDGSSNETPVHEVTLDSFELDDIEVTTAAFEQYIADNTPDTGWYYTIEDVSRCNIQSERKDHPVNCVSWLAANDYCEKQGKRLPTEAEWEYACGNGSTHASWSLDVATFTEANYCFQKSFTCSIKSYDANDFGLYDMSGNAKEWCADYYSPTFYSDNTVWTNPINQTESTMRVLRGGSFDSSDSSKTRTSSREGAIPISNVIDQGFRCARDVN